MTECVVRFKNSCNAKLREFFVLVNEDQIQQGTDRCWQQHESIFNSLDYGSDEEAEFQAFQHEIEVFEQGTRIPRVQRREKDDLCAWESAQGF